MGGLCAAAVAPAALAAEVEVEEAAENAVAAAAVEVVPLSCFLSPIDEPCTITQPRFLSLPTRCASRTHSLCRRHR